MLPLLGTSCVAGVTLVSSLQSPSLATVGILLGTLPLVTLAIHHGSQCREASMGRLPMQMQDVPAVTVSGAAETTPSSN